MPTSEANRPVSLQIPRVVKCPTPQCPGWITLDSTRHQTEPCRYCRIGVDTLRFLLSRVGAETKALPAGVHDEFNRLMLTMAGAWGRNVYLRPSRTTLVDLIAGSRGVTIEYNPLLGAAGQDGAAPLVASIFHKLLHFEAHLGQRVPQLEVKSGAKDKAGLGPLLSYLLTLADHAWVSLRLRELYPLLYDAQSRWGLDVAQMLVGSESMFNRYLSERNLSKLVSVLQSAGNDSAVFRASVLDRLSTLTAQILDHEKDDTVRLFLAVQLANVRLLNPDSYAAYAQALEASGFTTVREASVTAERLATELNNAATTSRPSQALKGSQERPNMVIEPAQFHHALESALKALGMVNYFEVKG